MTIMTVNKTMTALMDMTALNVMTDRIHDSLDSVDGRTTAMTAP